MMTPHSIRETLRRNLSLYEDLLRVVEAECEEVAEGTGRPLTRQYTVKKGLLPLLIQSLDPLAKCRAEWQQTDPAERSRHPDIGELARQCQDVLMKVIMLDRENEQALLRQGLLPAARLPSVNRQRPNFVADLYRRQCLS